MYFFNDTISIYTIAFSSLFNNIKVQRIDKKVSPNIIRELDVPLMNSSKLHWYLKKVMNQPDKFNINKILPRMSFSLDSFTPDSERQTNKFEKLQFNAPVSQDIREWCQTAVPYKFGFTLSIMTKYQTELNQIVEQILPFYPAKSRDIHVKEIPLIGAFRSVRLTLTGASQNINVEYSDKGDRKILYDLTFELDGYIYPPIKQDKIIKEVNSNVYVNVMDETYVKEVEMEITPETETE